MNNITVAKLKKMYDHVVQLTNQDILIVSRNTTGNLQPAFTQKMTVREALEYGAWDTTHGTMAASVRMHPEHHKNSNEAVRVGNKVYEVWMDPYHNY